MALQFRSRDHFWCRLCAFVAAAKLFVSNVEKQITEEELLQLFAGIGTVKSIALHFDKDGKSQVSFYLINFSTIALETPICAAGNCRG